jgi:type IV pilus assembly protein PilA
MRKQKGFSLIELLIVVAIILIIAAIAIPSLLRAKISANESAAAASIRQISTAQISYSASYPQTGYAANLAALGPADVTCRAGPNSTNACILDSVLSSGDKAGYTFVSVGSGGGSGNPNTQFFSGSAPDNYNVSGIRNFCMATDGVLRINPGPATVAADLAACNAYPIAQ